MSHYKQLKFYVSKKRNTKLHWKNCQFKILCAFLSYLYAPVNASHLLISSAHLPSSEQQIILQNLSFF